MTTPRFALLAPLLALLFASPAGAAAIVVAPASEAPADAAAPAPALPAASSSLVITLGTTGDFERKTVMYGCEGDVHQLAVDYINAAPNYLALLPLDGSVLVFNTVLSASGARYVAGKYVWSTKGHDASLYDLTLGDKADPVLSCYEVNETP